MFEQQPILVGRIFHPGRSHGCCPARATGGSLPCGRYLLASLNVNEEGRKCLMVLRVKPTPTRSPTNSLYTPMDNTSLHSILSVVHPWGQVGVRNVLVWFLTNQRPQKASVNYHLLFSDCYSLSFDFYLAYQRYKPESRIGVPSRLSPLVLIRPR